MYKIGDNVTINTDWAKSLDIPDIHGTIINILDTMLPSGKQSYLVQVLNEQYHLLEDELVSQTKLLTVADIQQLKEQLALDLLRLLETYEKDTQIHIANITLRTHRYFGDGVWFDRVTGVILTVEL